MKDGNYRIRKNLGRYGRISFISIILLIGILLRTQFFVFAQSSLITFKNIILAYATYGGTTDLNSDNYTNGVDVAWLAKNLPSPSPTSTNCSTLGGTVCENSSNLTCANSQWSPAADTDFCCLSACVANPVCVVNPDTGKQNDCACQLNPYKEKVAVLIKANGELDTDSVNTSISAYLEKAAAHRGKVSIGLKKFSGTTFDDLKTYVHDLYHNQGLGSLIIVGRDLPVFSQSTDVTLVSEAAFDIGYVDKQPVFGTCRDMSVSFVIPRISPMGDYSPIQFVVDTFGRFAAYHADTDGIRSSFKKEALTVQWDNQIDVSCGENLPLFELQRTLPNTTILNTQHQTLKNKMLEKFPFQQHDIHGAPNVQGLGLLNYPDGEKDCTSIYVDLLQFDDFIRQNPAQFLLVTSKACKSSVVDYVYFPNCCFPQKFLELGSWIYYYFGGGGSDIVKANDLLLSGGTVSEASRKLTVQSIVFGDILAGL